VHVKSTDRPGRYSDREGVARVTRIHPDGLFDVKFMVSGDRGLRIPAHLLSSCGVRSFGAPPAHPPADLVTPQSSKKRAAQTYDIVTSDSTGTAQVIETGAPMRPMLPSRDQASPFIALRLCEIETPRWEPCAPLLLSSVGCENPAEDGVAPSGGGHSGLCNGARLVIQEVSEVRRVVMPPRGGLSLLR